MVDKEALPAPNNGGAGLATLASTGGADTSLVPPLSGDRGSSRAWAEISQSALVHNLHTLRGRFGRRVMAVVKADAYGHGVGHIIPLCAAQGITDFGVATTEEGVLVRSLAPDARIYILAPTLPADAPAIVECGLVPLVSDRDMGRALSAAALQQKRAARVHLDIDTGIGRSGVGVNDAPALLSFLDALPHMEVTGIATHFASADEDEADAQAQWAVFAVLLESMGPRVRALTLHAGNSPAALVVPPAAELSLVRPGLLLYGIDPAPGMTAQAGLGVRPVLSLKARVLLCRALPAGASVSYGRTYRVPAGGGVYATVGIGYGDGFPRRWGGGAGHVLLHGQRAPICGRVCMDQCVVDVSRIPNVKAGDIATLVGTDGAERITASEIAVAVNTTPHEITTALLPRLPRLLTE